MRVTCHSCQTDYIVSDARVAGKRRTAHCGKCDSTFVIDGRGLLIAPEDDVWLVRHYEQSELGTEALTSALREGTLPLRGTVVWRRGMDDWVPIADVQHLSQHATPVALTAEAGARSPRPPAVATLDMALSNTSAGASTPASGVGVAPRPPVSDQSLRLLTPVPDGAPTPRTGVDLSPLNDAILHASQAPAPASPETPARQGTVTRGATTLPSPAPDHSGPTRAGALATARLSADPLIVEQDDGTPGLAATGTSGTRRIHVRSSRPPASDRPQRSSLFPGDAGVGHHSTPDSIRPMSAARAAAELADVQQGARAATRLSILAAAGFLACLALLHRFSGDSDPGPSAAPPAVAPRGPITSPASPRVAPATRATALMPPPPPPEPVEAQAADDDAPSPAPAPELQATPATARVPAPPAPPKPNGARSNDPRAPRTDPTAPVDVSEPASPPSPAPSPASRL